MNLSTLCLQVQDILRQAAEYMKRTFTTNEKESPSNIVTSTDIAIQEYLETALCSLLPGSAMLGEEECGRFQATEYLWVVDPIDGTTNFSRGIPECAISVGLLQNGTALLGVVYNPGRDRMFSGIRGMGAMCNGMTISVSKRTFQEGLLCTAMSVYKKEYAPQCMAVISEAHESCNDIRRFGSCALELCYLACGECDLYFEFRVFPWDYAGASLILEEAGGIIRGLNDQVLTYDRATPVVAANTRTNFEILNRIIKKHIPELPYEELL